jgi:hypothetical protein
MPSSIRLPLIFQRSKSTNKGKDVEKGTMPREEILAMPDLIGAKNDLSPLVVGVRMACTKLPVQQTLTGIGARAGLCIVSNCFVFQSWENRTGGSLAKLCCAWRSQEEAFWQNELHSMMPLALLA